MTSALLHKVFSRCEVDLSPRSIDVLQLNITRLCNQACTHCHVSASPSRREMMSDAVIDACFAVIASHPEITTVDITGGAPELHPRFADIVEGMRGMGRHVIVRHNLTVTLDAHPATGESMMHLPEFFTRTGVELVSSLPCYVACNTDRQRGDGVYAKSIESLKMLNQAGFGIAGSGLEVNIVTNPGGAFLHGSQRALEADFRRELAMLHGVTFNSLYVLANLPVGRFERGLANRGVADEYLATLAERYNPAAAEGVMCRSMVSVSHDGLLYDCDFNQMKELPIRAKTQDATIFDFDSARLLARDIRLEDHCLGCMAGSGSSCGGATNCA